MLLSARFFQDRKGSYNNQKDIMLKKHITSLKIPDLSYFNRHLTANFWGILKEIGNAFFYKSGGQYTFKKVRRSFLFYRYSKIRCTCRISESIGIFQST